MPAEQADIAETLDQLASNFNLDARVVKALLATKLQNLEEFRFLFKDETSIDPFLDKIQLGDDRLLQGARLRRAWTAVSLYLRQADQAVSCCSF